MLGSIVRTLGRAGIFAMFAGVALAAPASAAVLTTIAPGDNFTVSFPGFWQGGSYDLGKVTATFGTTQTFVGAGYNGQTITVSSNIVAAPRNPSRVVATFTVSTPVGFILQDKIDGNTIAGLGAYFGGEGAGDDPIDFTSTLTGAGGSGLLNYGTIGYTFNPITSLVGDTGLRAYGLWSSGSWAQPLNPMNPNSMTYTLEFNGVLSAAAPAVPEPATWALMIVGFAFAGAALRRRTVAFA